MKETDKGTKSPEMNHHTSPNLSFFLSLKHKPYQQLAMMLSSSLSLTTTDTNTATTTTTTPSSSPLPSLFPRTPKSRPHHYHHLSNKKEQKRSETLFNSTNMYTRIYMYQTQPLLHVCTYELCYWFWVKGLLASSERLSKVTFSFGESSILVRWRFNLLDQANLSFCLFKYFRSTSSLLRLN